MCGAKSTGLSFLEQGDRAFYSPSRDTVVTPPRGAFADEARWAETVLHEVGHASGADKPGRLNRQFGKRFGDRAYAFEELVAEATSAFVASELNLNRGDLSHAATYSRLRPGKRDTVRPVGRQTAAAAVAGLGATAGGERVRPGLQQAVPRGGQDGTSPVAMTDKARASECPSCDSAGGEIRTLHGHGFAPQLPQDFPKISDKDKPAEARLSAGLSNVLVAGTRNPRQFHFRHLHKLEMPGLVI